MRIFNRVQPPGQTKCREKRSTSYSREELHSWSREEAGARATVAHHWRREEPDARALPASTAALAAADLQPRLAAARLGADESPQRGAQRCVQQRVHAAVNGVHDEGDGCTGWPRSRCEVRSVQLCQQLATAMPARSRNAQQCPNSTFRKTMHRPNSASGGSCEPGGANILHTHPAGPLRWGCSCSASPPAPRPTPPALQPRGTAPAAPPRSAASAGEPGRSVSEHPHTHFGPRPSFHALAIYRASLTAPIGPPTDNFAPLCNPPSIPPCPPHAAHTTPQAHNRIPSAEPLPVPHPPNPPRPAPAAHE